MEQDLIVTGASLELMFHVVVVALICRLHRPRYFVCEVPFLVVPTSTYGMRWHRQAAAVLRQNAWRRVPEPTGRVSDGSTITTSVPLHRYV